MNLRPQNILPTALSTLAVLAVAAGPAEAAKMASFTPEGPGAQVKTQARTAAGCDNAGARAGEVSEAALASSTVCLLNVERTSRGLRALRVNGRLSAAAQQHTNDMVRKRYFSHTSRSGNDMGDRIRSQGYLERRPQLDDRREPGLGLRRAQHPAQHRAGVDEQRRATATTS